MYQHVHCLRSNTSTVYVSTRPLSTYQHVHCLCSNTFTSTYQYVHVYVSTLPQSACDFLQPLTLFLLFAPSRPLHSHGVEEHHQAGRGQGHRLGRLFLCGGPLLPSRECHQPGTLWQQCLASQNYHSYPLKTYLSPKQADYPGLQRAQRQGGCACP